MCTPAIGDIDGDGHDEIVIAVSYFYDRDYYDKPVLLLYNLRQEGTESDNITSQRRDL